MADEKYYHYTIIHWETMLWILPMKSTYYNYNSLRNDALFFTTFNIFFFFLLIHRWRDQRTYQNSNGNKQLQAQKWIRKYWRFWSNLGWLKMYMFCSESAIEIRSKFKQIYMTFYLHYNWYVLSNCTSFKGGK